MAVKLAAEADNLALAAHVLRAMAHQAVDLGHYPEAANLSAASVAHDRYTAACSREKALLGVVHARCLAEAGNGTEAAAALLRAENDLAGAGTAEEPDRVWFFQKASLAHETARALQAMGDLGGAAKEFQRSVRLREESRFTRTHAVTLGYLGDVQARQGEIEAACATWSRALDSMRAVRSGRARDTVLNMRRILSTVRNRGVGVAAKLDARAASLLRQVA